MRIQKAYLFAMSSTTSTSRTTEQVTDQPSGQRGRGTASRRVVVQHSDSNTHTHTHSHSREQINKLTPPAVVSLHYEHGAETEALLKATAFGAESIIRGLTEKR